MSRSVRLALTGFSLALLSACASMPDVAGMGILAGGQGETAPVELTPRERVRQAVELLGVGEERQATTHLRAALSEQPNNVTARRLLEQVEGDPQRLLGSNAYSYTVRQGETMSVLAQRFLGDPLLFYALARYNGLTAPNQLRAGQSLMIPVRPGISVATASALPRAAAAVSPEPGGAPTLASNAVRANQLRLQGLEQLNAGSIDRAVQLLSQARALDGGNAAIERDLNRALRIQASMNSRPAR